MKSTQGSETSQYLEEEKSSEIPLVAASEGGVAQTRLKHRAEGKAQRVLNAMRQALCPMLRLGVVGPHK
jgi:hypothetical protein